MLPFVPSKRFAMAVLWPRQISRMLFESILFYFMITAFLEFVGESRIIMTVVCQWVVPALAELFNLFPLSNGLPKRNTYRGHFVLVE